MAINPSSPVTGGAQTGLTSPTYTLVADSFPGPNGKQWAVSALGGTQAGVDVNLASKPFTLAVVKPRNFQILGTPNPATGLIASIPENIFKVITRKGAQPALNQPPRVSMIRTDINIVSGTENYSTNEILAMLSLHIGALNQLSAEIGAMVKTNTF